MKQFLALFVVVFCFLAVITASQSQAEQLTEELPSSEVRDHDQTNSLNENDQVERINQVPLAAY